MRCAFLFPTRAFADTYRCTESTGSSVNEQRPSGAKELLPITIENARYAAIAIVS